ncbi:MAG: type III-B CRISPR module-associated protein Cmr5 [Ignavibacteriaceae bacterium]|nr:type III-B CRISPR module-associated protein Cmr5 [Ignavibacteriaceae bacterium]
MNKKINELIPKALEAIKESKVANANNEVAKEYKGYVSSMGASIIQSGLLATLAFYSNEQSGSADKRLKLLKAIVKTILDINSNEKLLKYVLSNSNNGSDKTQINKFEKQISEALIALKLAIRTFKQE